MEKKRPEQKHNANVKNSRCPISNRCGGCQYIDKTYDEQLAKKSAHVRELLKAYGTIDEVIGMEQPYYYRNKVTATFHHKRNGEIISGIYEENSHKVLAVKDCLLENRRAQTIIDTIRGLLRSFKITVYNEDTGYGLLRHVMVRTGHATGEVMVVLVTASVIFPSKKNFAKALVSRHPEITTIVQNINEKDTNMVLGERNQLLYGKGYIEDRLCGKTFKISPNSFYQVNAVQTELLYNKAMEFAGLSGKETVLDAYCGTGTIGIVASEHAKQVVGVELNKAAVKDAIVNIKKNGCRNVTVYAGDAGKFMTDMASAEDADKSMADTVKSEGADKSMADTVKSEGVDKSMVDTAKAKGANQQKKTVDVVFMDPPRSGSSREFLDALLTLAPSRIVYISCGPESLARDLKYLVRKHTYRVSRIALVDLFPWTNHCESIVLLSKL